MHLLAHVGAAALLLAAAPAEKVAPAAGLAGPFDQAVASSVAGKSTGSILVASHGRILWIGSVGDANKGIPAPAPEAAFDSLSIGKTFTAIAVQRLATMGKIDLSASIRRYIPELPKTLDAVTIQSCLDNASGWGPYVNDNGDFDPESTKQLIRDLGTAERTHPIGHYGYLNTGFQALGLVVQRVTGKPFKQAIRELVFQPANLSSTEFLGSPSFRNRPVAVGWKDGKWTGSARTWRSTWSLAGAAGIASTVTDLYRLNRAFIAGNGLGAAGRERMLADGASTGHATPAIREKGITRVTYGSGLYHWRDAQGRHVHFHGGDADFGFHSAMFWREDDDLLVVGLFNSGDVVHAFDRSTFCNAFAHAADQLLHRGAQS